MGKPPPPEYKLRHPLNAFPIDNPPPLNMSSLGEISRWARRFYDSLRMLRQGKLDVNIYVTLTSIDDITEFYDPRLTIQSQLIWSPLNANASTLFNDPKGIYSYIDDRHDGHWTIRHANKDLEDMKFLVTIIG